jgi:NADH-quinone oxidoreductase subunit J
MTQGLFLGLGVLLLLSALLVILQKNPVTSALYLVLAFCSLAGLYIMMGAEFIGMVQIVVYAGAIMVLFLFVIMYLNLGNDIETGVQIALRRWLGWAIGGLIVAAGAVLLARGWATGPPAAELPPVGGHTQALGQVLYTRYLFPFEITSLVLLAAMVGVIVMGKGHLPGRPGQSQEKR